jgi:hypothetical protein
MAVMALLRFEPGVTSFQIVGLQAEVAQAIADYLGSSALIVVHRCQLNLKKRRCFVYEQISQQFGVVAQQSGCVLWMKTKTQTLRWQMLQSTPMMKISIRVPR